MKRDHDFDLIVIGAGIAGMVSAVTAASLGKRTAVVEKSRVGGSCTNTTCIPSKALIRLGHASREMAHLERLGLLRLPAGGLEGARIMPRIRDIVRTALKSVLNPASVLLLPGKPQPARRNRLSWFYSFSINECVNQL